MGHLTAIRDKAGALLGFAERADAEPLFTQMLRDTMTAVGAAEQPKEEETQRPRYRPGRREAAALVGGLILAVAAIAALNVFGSAQAPVTRPPAVSQPTQAPTVAPSPTIATQDGYASPEGARLGTVPLTSSVSFQHSDYPGWGGIAWENGTIIWVETDRQGLVSLPDLAPPPTRAPAPGVEAPVVAPAPIEACDPQVNPRYTAPRDVVPIGSVVGVSCTSQAEAEANGDMLAAEMRAAAQPSPTPAPNEAR
jgi:hypothetical protein